MVFAGRGSLKRGVGGADKGLSCSSTSSHPPALHLGWARVSDLLQEQSPGPCLAAVHMAAFSPSAHARGHWADVGLTSEKLEKRFINLRQPVAVKTGRDVHVSPHLSESIC